MRTPLFSACQAGGEIRRTELYVVHSGYDYSPEGQKNKRTRDLRLLEIDLLERSGHPFVLFNTVMTAFHMKDFANAKDTLEECLRLSKPNKSTVRKIYAMLAGCELEMGYSAVARDRIEQELKLFPRDPELLFRAGIVYRECGEPGRAEQSYLKLLNDHKVDHINSLDVSMTTWKAWGSSFVIKGEWRKQRRSETLLGACRLSW